MQTALTALQLLGFVWHPRPLYSLGYSGCAVASNLHRAAARVAKVIQFFNDRRGRALCGLGAAGAEPTAAATQPALTGRERGAAVLVGTPGPAGASQHHECVFWSRLGIGLLSAAATRAALVEPLAGHGVRIDADALDAAVEHCQR